MKSFAMLTLGLVIGAGVGVTAPEEVRVVDVWKPSKPMVKFSDGGICHPKGGQFYDYVKSYKPYDTLTQCVREGGRLPRKGQDFISE